METTEKTSTPSPTVPPFVAAPPRSRASTVLAAFIGPAASWIVAMAILAVALPTDLADRCDGLDLGCGIVSTWPFAVGLMTLFFGLPLVGVTTVVATLGLRHADHRRQRWTVGLALGVLVTVEGYLLHSLLT